MARNIKTIIVNVPSEMHLSKINSTFALKRLFRESLIVGNNTLKVNHFNYSEIVRMQCGLFAVIE